MSSSMRLGVPFIAPRQLGAVESNMGRQFLPSVVWRTGQFGARFLSLTGAADRWQPESHWCTGHVRCTPDSPVPPSSCWLGHVSRVDCAADRWLTGQSGELWSYVAGEFPRAASSLEPVWRTGHCPVHHRTVRCS
jgi:hypothetical protein